MVYSLFISKVVDPQKLSVEIVEICFFAKMFGWSFLQPMFDHQVSVMLSHYFARRCPKIVLLLSLVTHIMIIDIY